MEMKHLKLKDSGGLIGYISRIRKHDAITGKLIYDSGPVRMENKIVSSSGYGRNIVMRQLAGDNSYSIEVDSAQIGTGTTAPTDSDTALQTPVATFSITDVNTSNDTNIYSIFMTDALLANGTYSEFGLRCNGRLFSRVLISPTFTKGSNQNTTIDYTVQLTG